MKLRKGFRIQRFRIQRFDIIRVRETKTGGAFPHSLHSLHSPIPWSLNSVLHFRHIMASEIRQGNFRHIVVFPLPFVVVFQFEIIDETAKIVKRWKPGPGRLLIPHFYISGTRELLHGFAHALAKTIDIRLRLRRGKVQRREQPVRRQTTSAFKSYPFQNLSLERT